ncbi:MAG: hypothetical protein EGQ20_07180 [Bacteroides oleiciplenus]|nr:hypothetical protein [Bacteroides oleiciplenus]
MEHLTHWKNQFNYDYLGAYSLPDGKDIILTLKETKKEMVTGANGQKSECFVAYFHENAKPMILNKTNCKTIEKLFNTPNIEEWVNKQIQIGSTRINAFGEMTDCLRVRPFAPKLSEERPAVQTGSVIWKNILDALAGGYTVTQVMTKYKLTKEQIKELQKHEISSN